MLPLGGILTATVALLLLTLQAAQCADKCSESELEEKILLITGYVNDARYRYPKSDREFTKFCKDNKDAGKYLKEYSGRCLKGVSRTIISVFAYSNSRTIRRFCNTKNNSKGRSDMISWANCVNPNKERVGNCYSEFINKLNLTHTIPDPKKKIPYMCCLTLSELDRCLVGELHKSKHQACTEDVIQSYSTFFDSISSNIMNTICDGSEDSSDRCGKILRFVAGPKGKVAKVAYKTPFPIITAIFESL